jgi:hypothetical protein
MQRCPRSIKCMGATWGISGDVCHILLCSSTGMLTTFVSHIARANHRIECYLPLTIRMPSIFGELFFWWGTYRADMLHDIIHSYFIKKRILKIKRNLKIDSNSKPYLENPINFSASWFPCLISKFWVSPLFRKLMGFPTTSIFRVSSDLALIKPKSQSQEVTSFSSNRKF